MYGVFVNDCHDFKNYFVWIAVHVHLLPLFKFDQDKKIVIVSLQTVFNVSKHCFNVLINIIIMKIIYMFPHRRYYLA